MSITQEFGLCPSCGCVVDENLNGHHSAADCSILRFAEQHAKSEWISVKDRLPPESTHENPVLLLTCGLDGTVFCAFYTDGMFALKEYVFEDITHWMPLPPPPEAEK